MTTHSGMLGHTSVMAFAGALARSSHVRNAQHSTARTDTDKQTLSTPERWLQRWAKNPSKRDGLGDWLKQFYTAARRPSGCEHVLTVFLCFLCFSCTTQEKTKVRLELTSFARMLTSPHMVAGDTYPAEHSGLTRVLLTGTSERVTV